MYELIFDTKAIESLGKLPKTIGRRIFNKITSSKKDPFRYFIRLAGRTDYRLRVGEYRVVADIDRKSRKITVTLIRHRKDAYKVSK